MLPAASTDVPTYQASRFPAKLAFGEEMIHVFEDLRTVVRKLLNLVSKTVITKDLVVVFIAVHRFYDGALSV